MPRSIALKIEYLSLDDLVAKGRRARTHPAKQTNLLAKSVARTGYISPVVIDEQRIILAGHARLAVARKLGWKEVPTITLSHLSEAEKRAFVLADNRIAELAGWDKTILALELDAIIELEPGFDIELTGFCEVEVEAMSRLRTPDDEEPSPSANPTSQLGDLFELGPHKILCGDATRIDSYHALLGEEKVRVCFTDPPYNCPIVGHVTSSAAHREFPMAAGEMSEDQFTSFLSGVLACIRASMSSAGLIYTAMDWRNSYNLQSAARAVGLELLNEIVWTKKTPGMGSFYRSQHELIFLFKAGNEPHLNRVELGKHGRNRSNVWAYDGFAGFRCGGRSELKAHPTPKPVPLIVDALLDCSERGDLVLDPFSGGGSTLIAAHRANRRARVMELDPGYVDSAVLRWEIETGQLARHVQTGLSLADLRKARVAETKAREAAGPPPARARTRRAA